MFHKKYKVKTSTTVKGSERKKLQCLVRKHYPSLSEDVVNSLFSSKSELNQVKALTHSGEVAFIYCFGNSPLFFQVNNRLFPTVYMLWKFPDLLPTLPTDPFVPEKICNGADLMAPGVVTNDLTISEFQNLHPEDVCAVRVIGNQAPIAVGTAVQSGAAISADGRKGKAVLIAHCYKDCLWSSGDESHLPLIPDTISDTNSSDNVDKINEILTAVSISNDEASSTENDIADVPELPSENLDGIARDDSFTNEVPETDIVPYSMDDVLRQCFMTCLKVHGKKIQLPILTSTFYRTYVLGCCPQSMKLDIRKTTYKKLSIFLRLMVTDGLIDVKELKKGAESIVTINTVHESINEFCLGSEFKEHLKKQKEGNAAAVSEDTSRNPVQENYKFPDIVEMFVISAQVRPIFENFKYRKGDALVASEVRDVLRQYVKQNSLADENNPRVILLDPVLTSSLLKTSDPRTDMTWEELHEACISRMSPAYQITFADEEPKLKKGHIDTIEVSIATRTGNKKVTIINNLEVFGIKPQKLAEHMQIAAAASTSVSQAAGGKGLQVLVQGKQLHYLQKLFFDIYKVPRKYVKGLDSIPAKKKK